MEEMTTSRLEAFSDAVIAILITIMVLELRAPAEPTLAGLFKIAPEFVTYAISFLVIAIIWVNHHPLMHAARAPTARLLWSNLFLLFWMSFVPFVTELLGRDFREPLAVALYGFDLFLCTAGFYFLRMELIRQSRNGLALTKYHQRVQAQECFCRHAVSTLGSAGLPYDLRFVLHFHPAPRTLFSSGKETER
jgi:uncharacterized membrane protein